MKAEDMRLGNAAALTAYLIALLAIRVKWGYGPSAWVGVCILSLAPTCYWSFVCFARPSLVIPLQDVLFYTIAGYFLGLPAGLCCFGIVHYLVMAVDWIDSLMRTKG